MLSNYLKFTFRRIGRNKVYSILNIVGLSIGLSCFFVIYLFIQNELSYDQYHTNKDRIYRVIKTTEKDNGVDKIAGVTWILAPKAAEKIPRIKNFTRYGGFAKRISLLSNPDSLFSVPAKSVDLSFIEIFDLDFIVGDKESSFKSENSALINRSKAEQIFGSAEGAYQAEFKLKDQVFRIDGVFEDVPPNSSLDYSMLLPFNTSESSRGEGSWYISYFDQAYFELHEGADPEAVGVEIDTLYKQNMQYGNATMSLQSLNDVHFSLDVSDGLNGKSDRQYIGIFSGVALFILLCSVFNYVSLSLSQSVQRFKEVGIRKVIGANGRELFRQFIFESLVFVLISGLISFLLVLFSLPALEELLGRALGFNLLEEPLFIVQAFLFVVLLAILASLYPAYVSVRMQTASILKGIRKTLFSPNRILNSVSVFQTIVFIGLVCAAFVAKRQMEFMQNENLGFDNEQIMILRTSSQGVREKVDVLQNELLKIPNVERISFASSFPTQWGSSQSFNGHDFTFFNFTVDENYLETLGMKLLKGRNLRSTDTDSTFSVLINETAAKKLGISDDPIGHVIMNGKRKITVVGLVNDFHFVSKKQPIEAVMFRNVRSRAYGNLIMKLKSQDLKGTIAAVEKTFQDVTDKSDADYFFLDDRFNQQYEQETIMSTMINVFAGLAALVAFIGLFGISGYSTSRRLKEMGIRKVLGAGFFEIQKKLNSANLLKLLLAILISVPVAIYLMDIWLSSFAYRIEMPLVIVVLAVMSASIVILFTVSVHTIRAYLVNPVEVLKDE